MLSTVEFTVLRAIQANSFRPRTGAKAMIDALCKRGCLTWRGGRLCLTEDGIGAIEAWEADRDARQAGKGGA